MRNISIIREVLQQSPAWEELPQEKKSQLIEEGLFVYETLETSPFLATYSEADQERIFLQAWLSYERVSNLAQVPNH